MNTCDLLENCIQIERIVGQIYDIFSQQQASCPECAELWEKTAREEHNHEQQFIMAKRLACSVKTESEGSHHPSDELVRNLTVLKSRLTETSLSPRESFRLAIDMEEKLAAFHMNQICIFPDDATNRLFSSMMNNDYEHIDMLKKMYALLE
jgi:rubrerythrin